MATFRKAKRTVLKQYPPIGPRYKVHLLQQRPPGGGKPRPVLDIREFRQTPKWSGFTGRGIQIYSMQELADALLALQQVTADAPLPQKSSPPG